jgi:YVTN family beta-propeller protein
MPQAMQFCDGTNWDAMKNTSLSSCSGTAAGTQQYASSKMQFCDGTSWWDMTAAPAALYVANFNSGTVSVINPTANTVTATITVGSEPNATAVTNGFVYVANENGKSVSVITRRHSLPQRLCLCGEREPRRQHGHGLGYQHRHQRGYSDHHGWKRTHHRCAINQCRRSLFGAPRTVETARARRTETLRPDAFTTAAQRTLGTPLWTA